MNCNISHNTTTSYNNNNNNTTYYNNADDNTTNNNNADDNTSINKDGNVNLLSNFDINEISDMRLSLHSVIMNITSTSTNKHTLETSIDKV